MDGRRFTPQLLDRLVRLTSRRRPGQSASPDCNRASVKNYAPDDRDYGQNDGRTPLPDLSAPDLAPDFVPDLAPYLARPCAFSDWGIASEADLPRFSAPVILCGECASSLDVAWRLAATDQLPVFGSVLALSQNAGRGQLRRPWLSPPGNIYAAWRLPLEGVLRSQGASVVLGFLFCGAFAALGRQIQLKWPNDLILNRRKLGGILLEERNGILLAGIGLNINSAPPEEFLRAGHAVSATALCRHSQPPEKITQSGLLRLWSALVQEALMAYKNKVLGMENETVFETAQDFLAFKNEKVKISEPNTTQDLIMQGRIAGLTRDGGLRLTAADGSEVCINSGSPVPAA